MKKITITITTKTQYLDEQSAIKDQRFLWSYEITIENQSEEMVQLLNRYWRITDMSGKIEEVRGPGVIGLQPVIKPGKKFVYTSFCQLTTPQGTMEGFYEMQNLDELKFNAIIPKFVLSCPSAAAAEYRSRLH